MSPARQNIWFIVVGIVLLAALVGARVTGGLGGGGAQQVAPSLPEQGASVGDPDGSETPGGASSWPDGDEDGVLGDVDGDFEAVPMALIFQLVDTMQAAGIPPVMPSDVVVEYVDGYDSIVVRGEFENTSATEAHFEWRDEVWRLVEPTGPE